MITVVNFLDVPGHLSQNSLLDASFHHSGMLWICVVDKMGRDDGSADSLGGIDDLLDARHSQGDMCSAQDITKQSRIVLVATPCPLSLSLSETNIYCLDHKILLALVKQHSLVEELE